jgi:hypothetical protein
MSHITKHRNLSALCDLLVNSRSENTQFALISHAIERKTQKEKRKQIPSTRGKANELYKKKLMMAIGKEKRAIKKKHSEARIIAI